MSTSAEDARRAKLAALKPRVLGDKSSLLASLRQLLADGPAGAERKAALRRWLESRCDSLRWVGRERVTRVVEKMDDDDFPEAVIDLCRLWWSFVALCDQPAAAVKLLDDREDEDARWVAGKVKEQLPHLLAAVGAYEALHGSGVISLKALEDRRGRIEADIQRLQNPLSRDPPEGGSPGRPASAGTTLGQGFMEILVSAGFGRAADNTLGVEVAVTHAQALADYCFCLHRDPPYGIPARELTLSAASLRKSATSALRSFRK